MLKYLQIFFQYSSRMQFPWVRVTILLALATAGCAVADPVTRPWDMAPDTHSNARPAEVRSTHLALELTLDFCSYGAPWRNLTHVLFHTVPECHFRHLRTRLCHGRGI